MLLLFFSLAIFGFVDSNILSLNFGKCLIKLSYVQVRCYLNKKYLILMREKKTDHTFLFLLNSTSFGIKGF